MKNLKTKTILLFWCAALFAVCAKQNDSAPPASWETLRVVSVGGAVTETIYALGEESKIVGADTSNVFPEAATKLP